MYQDQNGNWHQDSPGESVPCAMANMMAIAKARNRNDEWRVPLYCQVTSHFTSYNSHGYRIGHFDTIEQASAVNDAWIIKDNICDAIVWFDGKKI